MLVYIIQPTFPDFLTTIVVEDIRIDEKERNKQQQIAKEVIENPGITAAKTKERKFYQLITKTF